MTAPALARLRVYRFKSYARFEGAIEQMELTGSTELRLHSARQSERRDTRDRPSQRSRGRDGRGDARFPARRARAAGRNCALAAAGGVPRGSIERIATALEPGAAVPAVLLGDDAPPVVEEAVSRTGGRRVAEESVRAARLRDLTPSLMAAMGSAGAP